MKAAFSAQVDVVDESGAYVPVPPKITRLLRLVHGTVVKVVIETENGG